jgi:hypothetical protein
MIGKKKKEMRKSGLNDVRSLGRKLDYPDPNRLQCTKEDMTCLQSQQWRQILMILKQKKGNYSTIDRFFANGCHIQKRSITEDVTTSCKSKSINDTNFNNNKR